MSILSERPKDCLGCKLISGFGLIGAGLYVMSNARKFSGFQKGSMMTLASFISVFGAARLLDYDVFPVRKNKADEK